MRPGLDADVVFDALQRYAARGVFRGFSVRRGRGGRDEFRFTWLTRQPMTIAHDRGRRRLSFRHLLPRVDRYAGLAAGLRRVVADHGSRAVPTHRRIDARRTRVHGSIERGNFSLEIEVRGRNDGYAVQRGLNLVHQLFLLLHANYPEYLVECFGFRPE